MPRHHLAQETFLYSIFPSSKQLNERRPGDAQHVGGFLRRQFRVNWNDGDGVSATHLVQDFDQQSLPQKQGWPPSRLPGADHATQDLISLS